MLFSNQLMRLEIMAIALANAIAQAYSKKRGVTRLTYLVSFFLTIYALVHIFFVAFLWVNHISFPLNLEAMELTVLEHLKRVLAGQILYPEPTTEFVALAYTPLYYYLAVPFAWLFGTNLFALRLVAILGMLGAGLVIFLAIRRSTGSKWWGLIAVGLFAAAYRVMDTYLDTAHSDSWLLFTTLLGCYLIDQNRSRVRDLLGVFFIVAAFWFKQHGALFAIGAVVYLTWREGWRKSWSFWLLAAMLGPGLYVTAPTWLFGSYFHYFTWEVPRQWSEFNLSAIRRLIGFIVRSYFVLATFGLVVSAFTVLRLRSRMSIWYFMLPIAMLSGLLGALDPGSNNNVFIPMGVWFIITGVLGLKQFLDHFEHAERTGLHLIVLGASFALFMYNPVSVIVPYHTDTAYQDMVSYLKSLDGPVYAPWLGQLQDGYRFYPAVHWVPLEDMIRGPGGDTSNHPNIRKLLEPVLYPKDRAYILMNYPLENDSLISFLQEKYVLERDFGERFAPLATLPRRFNPLWPRYLYRFAPEEASQQVPDNP